mmetsp:Transcript_10352/g.23670  ORF Transcript_10352/g.23670 Transcript_10352/m.23670 type:complete len:242 (+) Transcript_10352:2950-3675(+)
MTFDGFFTVVRKMVERHVVSRALRYLQKRSESEVPGISSDFFSVELSFEMDFSRFLGNSSLSFFLAGFGNESLKNSSFRNRLTTIFLAYCSKACSCCKKISISVSTRFMLLVVFDLSSDEGTDMSRSDHMLFLEDDCFRSKAEGVYGALLGVRKMSGEGAGKGDRGGGRPMGDDSVRLRIALKVYPVLLVRLIVIGTSEIVSCVLCLLARSSSDSESDSDCRNESCLCLISSMIFLELRCS